MPRCVTMPHQHWNVCAVNDNVMAVTQHIHLTPSRERIYNQVAIYSVINIDTVPLLKVSTLRFFIKPSQTWRVSHQTGAARDERDESEAWNFFIQAIHSTRATKVLISKGFNSNCNPSRVPTDLSAASFISSKLSTLNSVNISLTSTEMGASSSSWEMKYSNALKYCVQFRWFIFMLTVSKICWNLNRTSFVFFHFDKVRI